jgi:signal peptidase I
MKKKNGTLKFIFEIIIILFATYIIVRFVASKTTVDGVSMYPTLSNGENVVIDKLSYRLGEPERFDIVVFEEDISETGYYIKRIIGLPGDSVTIDKRGNIYINGKVLRDRYGYGVIADAGIASGTVEVGEGEYFVLGDNRNNSIDSRFVDVGNVPMEKILGKVTLRLSPIEKFGYIDLYMERQEN